MNQHCPICEGTDLRERPERLRDSDELRVLACSECEHVFLSSFAHVDEAYFVNNEFLLSKPFLSGVDQRRRHYQVENEERVARVGPLVVNKTVLDFGCGEGMLMRGLRHLALRIDGLDRTSAFRSILIDDGYRIFEDIGEVTDPYDVILMFHVVEHLPDPIAILKSCVELLNSGGLLFVEVPNVNDALLTLYEVEAYRKFHFFRDHLHYFSRGSLKETFRRAGLPNVVISGHNRFGLANHLYWLKAGKPGGHMIWNFLETPSVFLEYTRALGAMDMSDSLVAQIRKR